MGASCSNVMWNPWYECVTSDKLIEYCPLEEPEGWSIPLDPASPWPARMAVVAAWMLGVQEIRGASLYWSDVTILTCASLVDGDREYLGWSAETGEEYYIGELNLPTLPSHLNNHDPEVALLLALWDAPELRARVEATQ